MILAGALLAWLAPMAVAETADEVVTKYVAARGGMEKIKAIKSVKATGKMVVSGGAMEAPFVQMQRRPNDFRLEFVFQGMTGVQVFDGSGKVAWGISPFMGKKEPETAPAEETNLLAEQADIDGALIDWKEKGHQLELVGKEQVEGADAFKLKLTRKSGTVEYIYIDAETGLEVKSEQKRIMRGTEVESESYLSDFKEVDGVPFAHTMSQGVKGGAENQRVKFVIEKYELNAALPDSLFKLPANAVKASAAPKDTTKAAAKTDTKPTADAKTAAKKK
jgi:outer membrane lipoprotein-sorting protein